MSHDPDFTPQFEEIRRPLRAEEVKRIDREVRRLDKHAETLVKRCFETWLALGILPLLVLITGLRDPVNRYGAVGMWLLLAVMVVNFGFFERREKLRERSKWISLKSSGICVVTTIRSERCLLIQADDQEGNDWIFEIPEGVYVLNDVTFRINWSPSTETVLTRIFDTDGNCVLDWIKTRGPRLEPIRILSRDQLPEGFWLEPFMLHERSFDDLLKSLS